MVRVRMKHSVVFNHNGTLYKYGKGAEVEVPDRVYVDNWGLMERLDQVEFTPPKVEKLRTPKRLKTPKAKPYAETASVRMKTNAALKKPKQK